MAADETADTQTPAVQGTVHEVDAPTLRRVIVASSLGTLFEWYDFYLYGSLAVFFGGLFFPKGNETAQLLASLATFGAGLRRAATRRRGVRPHRGSHRPQIHLPPHHGDDGARHRAHGALPTYESIGIAATVLLVLLRLLQGLALGGEYGGAATYVAEHVPDSRRGFYTSFIQTTATLGFFVSMGVIGTARHVYGEGFQGRSGGASPSCSRSCSSGSRSTSAPACRSLRSSRR
jgi:MFS family permease